MCTTYIQIVLCDYIIFIHARQIFQVEIPQLKRDAAQVAQERRRPMRKSHDGMMGTVYIFQFHEVIPKSRICNNNTVVRMILLVSTSNNEE